MRVKGKIFPSFDPEKQGRGGQSGKAGPGRALPAGQQYTGFCGTKAATRYLRQQCQGILTSKEPGVQTALTMSSEAIPNRYQYYFFLSKAKKVSEETGVSLIDAMNSLLEQFEELRRPKETEDGAENRASVEGAVEDSDRRTT